MLSVLLCVCVYVWVVCISVCAAMSVAEDVGCWIRWFGRRTGPGSRRKAPI